MHSGIWDVVFHVDKGGYVPGEKVKIYGKINNGTEVQIRKSYVELVQIIKLRTNRKVKTVRNPVTGLRHHSIPAGATDVWDTDCLTIPELPPTNSGTFTIAYCLQLVIVPAGLNPKVKLPIEIVIGTVQGGVHPHLPLEAPAYLPYDSPERVQPFALGEDQFDIINSHVGRIQLQIAPPPYIPTDEPPPPYDEVDQRLS
ncbi:arrestin domain-containing protein 17-like [Liolophura sinensis]|uniref:arrestin domain-containing protein 17-like n=1 Tax=Liolophura sinensis TaxID=3198878 RepID=UPI0031584CA7